MPKRAEKARERAKQMWKSAFNLPNQLTFLRLLLAVVMFGVIDLERYAVATGLFLLAAGTDWLDGYFARKYNQVTTLGRILDPFADKVIICGTFIYLVTIPAIVAMPYGLRAWMVVVVVGRELLVTALRSFVEDHGVDFSASMSGKLKMVLQCVAAAACLISLSMMTPDGGLPEWIRWTTIISIWLAVVLTVYSGLIYIVAAARLVRSSR